eukprot:TRINITY_DN6382_c0_g2_i1.p1 TRINITY_DN6382_c0_g2~~TRINITY_DN6382_c0_g2_i1.p1  ORF type:complete len:247 (-),score=46.06 TRINITY_DN6382_c0_g2_i1:78-818(-)
MRTEYDILCKFLVVGESGSGKSSLLARYSDNAFEETYMSTIGVDFRLKQFEMDGKIVRLQIWDTAGQERFRSITTSFYRGADASILAFDLTDRATFVNLDRWIEEVHKFAPQMPMVLVGTKSDVQHKRMVSFEDAKKYAEANHMPYIETSSKKNHNVTAAFETLTRLTIETKSKKSTEFKTSNLDLATKSKTPRPSVGCMSCFSPFSLISSVATMVVSCASWVPESLRLKEAAKSTLDRIELLPVS